MTVLGIAIVAAGNVYLNNKSSYVSVALRNFEALSSSENYSCSTCKWSGKISCRPLAVGSYSSCVLTNGTGNSCQPAGSTTCTCGVNCLPDP